MARVFADVLGQENVGRGTDFFDAAPPTVNGKLDLWSLPMPELAVAENEPPHTVPGTTRSLRVRQG
ncbi:hypothetical protein ACWEK5_43055 [Rhodococcus koreensis]